MSSCWRRPGARLGSRELVPAFDTQAAASQIQAELAAGGQAADAGEEAVGRLVGGSLGQEARQHPQVGRSRNGWVGEQALDLRSEDEEGTFAEVEERLHAEAVPGAEQPVLPGIVEGEGPHAVQPVQGGWAPFRVGGQQHLGVGGGVEGVAESLELPAELEVVEDLAVVGDGQPAVGGDHGPVPRGREVDDGEPAMT